MFATTAGTTKMHLLFVENLDIQQQVTILVFNIFIAFWSVILIFLSTLTAARVFSNAYFGEHPRPNISNVLCYGNESKLLDCSYTNISSCSPSSTAGVHCQGDMIPG